jgi:hypothetical protein
MVNVAKLSHCPDPNGTCKFAAADTIAISSLPESETGSCESSRALPCRLGLRSEMVDFDHVEDVYGLVWRVLRLSSMAAPALRGLIHPGAGQILSPLCRKCGALLRVVSNRGSLAATSHGSTVCFEAVTGCLILSEAIDKG